MSNWRTLFEQAGQQPYLGHWDLEVNGKFEPKEVVIEKFYVGEFNTAGGKEMKVFANIAGYKKPMVVNKENMKRLKKVFGTENYEEYIGKPVVLTVEKTFSATDKEMVDCLRFSTRPLPKKELPIMTDVEFAKAKANVEAGKTSIEKLEALRKLTPEQKNELLSIGK